jgi:hypothetical protein
MTKAKMSKFGGKNFATFLQDWCDRKHEIGKYFHFDSKFWTALVDHIAHAPRSADCVVDLPSDYHIPWHRGSGPAISFRGAYVGGGHVENEEWIPSDFYYLDFAVTFVHKNDDDEYPATKEKEYCIAVPFDLEMNFSFVRFDAWVTKQLDKEYQERLEELDKKITKLQSLRGELVKSLESRQDSNL